MLVLTGVLIGLVLVVMTGGTALTFQYLGWLPSHPLPFAVPGWMGSWFEVYGTWGDDRRPAPRRGLRDRLVLPRPAPQGAPPREAG